MNYKIYPINQGTRIMDIHDVVYRQPVGEDVSFAYGAFLLKDAKGKLIMVDSGAPSLSEVREKGYPLRTPDEDIDMVEEVRKHGVDPAEVSMIIYTHLHWDHAWNTNSFPNATLIAQAAEMAAAINPMKIGRKSYGFMEESNGPEWLHSIMRFQAVNGDVEILPGIRVIMTPGHTIGSQSVLVDTEKGVYMLPGDWIMCDRNLDMELPGGSTPDVAAWYQSLEKVKKLEFAGIIPCHDPKTYTEMYYG